MAQAGTHVSQIVTHLAHSVTYVAHPVTIFYCPAKMKRSMSPALVVVMGYELETYGMLWFLSKKRRSVSFSLAI